MKTRVALLCFALTALLAVGWGLFRSGSSDSAPAAVSSAPQKSPRLFPQPFAGPVVLQAHEDAGAKREPASLPLSEVAAESADEVLPWAEMPAEPQPEGEGGPAAVLNASPSPQASETGTAAHAMIVQPPSRFDDQGAIVRGENGGPSTAGRVIRLPAVWEREPTVSTVRRLPATTELDGPNETGVSRLPPVEIVNIPEHRGVGGQPPEEEGPKEERPPVGPGDDTDHDLQPGPGTIQEPISPTVDAPGSGGEGIDLFLPPIEEEFPESSPGVEEPGAGTPSAETVPSEINSPFGSQSVPDASNEASPAFPPLSGPLDDRPKTESVAQTPTDVDVANQGFPWRPPRSVGPRGDRPWGASRSETDESADPTSPLGDGEVQATPTPMTPQQLAQAVDAVRNRVKSHLRRGTALADRRAFFSARTEFINALRVLGQALEAPEGTIRRSDALARGLWALEEADDFIPRNGTMNAEMDLAGRIAVHRTKILKSGVAGTTPPRLTPLRAVQAYYTYAQEQLAAAVKPAPEGSRALSALGKLYAQLDVEPTRLANDPRTKGLVFQQAALLVDANNAKAANELGVLLAREGRYAEARDWLRHSVKVLPQREAWHNLAVVHTQLGERQHAAAAQQQSLTLAARDTAGRPLPLNAKPRVKVKKVDPAQFSGVTAKPKVEGRPAQPNPRAARRSKQSSGGLWSWLPWR